jgi:hypothetical protein
MIRFKVIRFLPVLLLTAFSITSCSGPKTQCTTNCVQQGTASVSISITDTPPANTSIMSFTMPILGVTLTPSGGGSKVPLFSPSSAANFELTRLQSDSDLVATNVSVAAGTYTAVNVTVAAPSAVLFNGSGAAIGSCANRAACSLPQGSPGTITFTFPSGSPLVLTANQKQWLDLDFNYNNAIVSTSASVTIDATQPNVLTALATPLTGVPSGDFANIDDFTGQVTALSSSSITIKSTVRGSLTASITSSIPVNDPQFQCSGGGTLSCIKTGSIVSLQGVLTKAGVISGTELDVIDVSTTPADEAEGTIYTNTSCASGFGMILSDSIILSSSPLASAGFGQNVCLTLGTNATSAVDTGILTNQGVPITGFSGLFAGQTVRVKVTSAVSGTNVINATASALILRFSRLTATVNSVTSPTFTITGLPVYFASTPTTTPAVQTYLNATIFEGVSGIGSLTTGPVSISALFLNPTTSSQPFQAAKVRVP